MKHSASFACLLFSCMAACGVLGAQVPQNEPAIGYVYPAGGCRGTTVRIVVAGQRLRTVVRPLIHGAAVSAQFIQYEPAGGLLNRLQEEELRRQIAAIRSARGDRPREQAAPTGARLTPERDRQQVAVLLPPLPELESLDQKTNAELASIARRFLDRNRRAKPPIAETVTFDLTIPHDAVPGVYALRVMGRNGLSTPVPFTISDLPERSEPLDPYETAESNALACPCVANGRIMPGEADRWVVSLQKATPVHVAVSARALIPYLADGVPGWFQPVLTIYDHTGRIAAYADDTTFAPDPVLVFQPEHTGTYTIEVRDAIWRGRQDFVYRLCLQPASPSRPGASPHAWPSLQHITEREPNNAGQQAHPVTVPCVVSGILSSPHDRDVYRISGRKGQSLVVDVRARRDQSPADPLVRLIDANWRVVAWNDDTLRTEEGLLTHHADPYLRVTLPNDGVYYVQISDAQRHGGPDYTYQMRISQPIPGFSVLISPSACSVPSNGSVMLTAHICRQDGWSGAVRLALVEPTSGYTLDGAVIPAGADVLPFTVSAKESADMIPQTLRILASAVDDPNMVGAVQSVDEHMQAFAYTHLVATGAPQIMTLRTQGSGVQWEAVSLEAPLRVPVGGEVRLSALIPRGLRNRKPAIEPVNVPDGITVQQHDDADGVVTLTIHASPQRAGRPGNLVFVVTADPPVRDGAAQRGRRQTLGVLPAVPFTTVR